MGRLMAETGPERRLRRLGARMRLPRAGEPPSHLLVLAAALAMVAAIGTAVSAEWTQLADRLIRGVTDMKPPPAVEAAEAQAPAARPAAPATLRGGSPHRRYGFCTQPRQQNCVVDGDTFRDGARAIRLADIDAPEIFSPQCPAERELGERAARRLHELLNDGVIVIAPAPDGREEDPYGRKLRVVRRGGKSLGDTLVEEGLARPSHGARRGWCG
jgi:endonuclease YncB( thermonuclease family)